jgi:hypothetical protein
MSLATSILVIGSSIVGFGATAASAAASPINLTFEDFDIATVTDYDGNVSTLTTTQPAGVGFTSGKAMQLANDGAPWSGTTFLTLDSTSSLISAANKTATISVYAPDAQDRCVDLKLEGAGATAEKTLHISGAGWQTMTFNYADVYDSSKTYFKASLMPNIAGIGCSDWGGAKGLTTWFVDNISFPGAYVADVVTPTLTTRVTGINADNAYVGSCNGWCQYYAPDLRYFERGVTVGTTTTISYTVTSGGTPWANKPVHLLLNKAYSGSTASITVNGVTSTGAEAVVDLTTNAQGVVTFDLTNNNVATEADPNQAANVVHPANGKHLFSQIALVGEKGNYDVLDVLDLVFYKPADAPAPTTYNVRLADWNASNSFDGTHIWGDGGLGNWFDVNTRYFAHYVAAGSTFTLRYRVTNAATGANAPDGTVVTLKLGAAWSGSNAQFTVNGVTVDGLTKWGANGQMDMATTTATVSGGYITVSATSNDEAIDATENPGSPTAIPDGHNPVFMQVKVNVEGNAITQQDWVNIVATAPAAAPTITSVSATTGKRGQAIDIVGTHLGDALGGTVTLFTPATAKTAAISTPVTVLAVSADGTRLTVASPAVSQKGNFKVTNSGGSATAAALFTASSTTTAKPAILLTSSMVKEVGATFTLNGTNLASATNISIGGVSASFKVLTAGSVLVTVPAGVTSGSTISATNLGGTVTSTKVIFQAATITDATASAKVGQTVTITGTNLKATSVIFGGNKSAKPVINNGTTLTVVVPTGALTGAIKITTGAGVIYTDSFTVVPPAPTVTSFTPATGRKGVTLVTVKGTNLLGATVTVGSTQVTVASGASSTSLKFIIPAGASSGRITVTTAGGSATSTATLTTTN